MWNYFCKNLFSIIKTNNFQVPFLFTYIYVYFWAHVFFVLSLSIFWKMRLLIHCWVHFNMSLCVQVASWTKYWVALCGTQLYYYPAKSLKATERKHVSRTETLSHRLRFESAARGYFSRFGRRGQQNRTRRRTESRSPYELQLWEECSKSVCVFYKEWTHDGHYLSPSKNSLITRWTQRKTLCLFLLTENKGEKLHPF